MMMRMLFPEGRMKALTFSYDDGVEQDIRLMEIFNKNGLKGTFNINGEFMEQAEFTYPEGTIGRRMGYKLAKETYGGELGKNHEVAVHSYTHPFLDRIPRPVASYEVAKDREVQEKTVNDIRARGMRPDEGGLGRNPAGEGRLDVSKLTRDQRAEMAKRAMRGEKISLQ